MKAIVVIPKYEVAVSAASPLADVSYVSPFATITVPYITITALLDERGLHRVVREDFSISDTPKVLVAKGVNDLIGFGDFSQFNLNLSKHDVVSLTDQFSRTCSFHRAFSDIAVIADLAQIEVGKIFADVSNISDISFAEFQKGSIEIVPFSEYRGISSYKSLTDSVACSDGSFSKAWNTSRTELVLFTDSIGIVSIDYCSSSYFAEDYVEGVSLI